MTFSESYSDYTFSSGAVYSLSDGEYRYHQSHYKTGQKNFAAWIAQKQGQSRQIVQQDAILKMGASYAKNSGELSAEALHNLRRWLSGRQICYCHHLRKGDANDEHLHPISIALELVRMFRPDDSSDIIAECTPSNLRTLVSLKGSEMAKKMYAGSASGPKLGGEKEETLEREYEQKKRRMSQESWRTSSTVSTDGAGSRRSSTSSVSSLWSSSSWRAQSPSRTVQVKKSSDFLSRNWRSP